MVPPREMTDCNINAGQQVVNNVQLPATAASNVRGFNSSTIYILEQNIPVHTCIMLVRPRMVSSESELDEVHDSSDDITYLGTEMHKHSDRRPTMAPPRTDILPQLDKLSRKHIHGTPVIKTAKHLQDAKHLQGASQETPIWDDT